MFDPTVTSFEQRLARSREPIEAYLKTQLVPDGAPAHIEPFQRALWYAVEGGKRVRPLLALGACEVVGGERLTCLPAACAVELFHAYSLVHDDLPAMDDDDERRGRPSVHRQFGEATAILVGDALLTLGFEWIATRQAATVPAERVLQALSLLGRALGVRGMAGGQYLDVQQRFADEAQLGQMQDMKTGALLSAAAAVGALLGGGDARDVERLSRFGLLLGRAYQWVDDLIDQRQDGGQNASSLERNSRTEVEQRARLASARAVEMLESYGARATWLVSLANHLLIREN